LRKEIVIDGDSFNDLKSFFDEVDKKFTKDLDWKTGHNLNAFNDLLRGGFGIHEYGEPISVKWINFEKSAIDFGYSATQEYFEKMLKTCHPLSRPYVQERLEKAKLKTGETLMDIIVEIILDTDDTGHDCILEKAKEALAR
jgi:RNAse (barnase) inhibitor barstar